MRKLISINHMAHGRRTLRKKAINPPYWDAHVTYFASHYVTSHKFQHQLASVLFINWQKLISSKVNDRVPRGCLPRNKLHLLRTSIVLNIVSLHYFTNRHDKHEGFWSSFERNALWFELSIHSFIFFHNGEWSFGSPCVLTGLQSYAFVDIFKLSNKMYWLGSS